MARITFKGKEVKTLGSLPEVGTQAPEFTFTRSDLSEVTLSEFAGKNVVLNIFPSIDTPVCAASVRRFNEVANRLANTVVLCVSMDLPFAHKRFCAAEGLENVGPVSEFRHASFGDIYAVRIDEGDLKGLLSRVVLVIDPEGKIIYTEQVAELTDEPNYEAVLSVLQ